MTTKKIDIDPKTGAVIVTQSGDNLETKDTTKDTGFEIKDNQSNQISPTDTRTKVVEANITNAGDSKDNLVDLSGPGAPSAQMENLIKNATDHNVDLSKAIDKMDVISDKPAEVYIEDTPSQRLVINHNFTARLRMILKDNGMDSQQQIKAIEQITALLTE